MRVFRQFLNDVLGSSPAAHRRCSGLREHRSNEFFKNSLRNILALCARNGLRNVWETVSR